MIDVRRFRADEAQLLRRLRLAALADAPEAFCATLAEERAFADEVWERRAASNAEGVLTAGFYGLVGDAPVGLAVGVAVDGADTPAEVSLNGMWVAPEGRGRGVGRALIEAVCAWASDRGATRVVLDAMAVNTRAIGLYQACGFALTDASRARVNDPDVVQLSMVRALDVP